MLSSPKPHSAIVFKPMQEWASQQRFARMQHRRDAQGGGCRVPIGNVPSTLPSFPCVAQAFDSIGYRTSIGRARDQKVIHLLPQQLPALLCTFLARPLHPALPAGFSGPSRYSGAVVPRDTWHHSWGLFQHKNPLHAPFGGVSTTSDTSQIPES